MLSLRRAYLYRALLPFFLLGLTVSTLQAQEPKKDGEFLTVVDFSGTEHKVDAWKFTLGTRHLTWLASDEEKKAAKGKGPMGLEVLEFSEGKTPPLKVRVVTLVPVESIRAIDYDHKKETVKLHVAGKDKDIVLEGLTGYVGVNMLSIDAESDLGELGKATVKFRGGVQRGVKSIRFPSPKPVADVPKGRPAKVMTGDRAKTEHQAVDLQPVYSTADHILKPESSLHFQKTVHISLDKIDKMSQVGTGAGGRGLVFDVTLKNDLQKPLALVESRLNDKKQQEVLIGLVGRVEAGYKLFPMQTIAEISFSP